MWEKLFQEAQCEQNMGYRLQDAQTWRLGLGRGAGGGVADEIRSLSVDIENNGQTVHGLGFLTACNLLPIKFLSGEWQLYQN